MRIICLLLVVANFAQALERYSNRCALATGTVSGSTVPLVAAACTVTVFNSGTVTLSTLFSDDGVTPLANPFTAQDGVGRFHFYAANGVYDVRLTGGTPTIGTVTIGAVTLGASGGGAVSSVFGRTGAVVAASADYSAAQVTNAARTDANNVFGAFYMDLAQIAAPASPGAGTRRLFVNSATGEYSLKKSDGTVISLEALNGTFAPVDATYITKTVNTTLTNEFALGSLSTGIVKVTTATGDLSIAVGADLPSHNHTESQITDLGTTVAVPQTRTISTTSPLGGGGTLAANRTLTCATCEVTTAKDGVSGYAGLDASSRIKVAAFPVLTGDITTPGGSFATTLATSGIVAGTYTKITFDAKGRGTSGTTLVAGDLPSHVHSAADVTSGTLAVARGGTGQTTYSAGDLLIGTTAGSLTKATLTAGANVTITPGDGSITIDTTGGGITDLNGQTANTQSFAVGSTGNDVNIASAGTIHTFHFPSSSAANRGVLTAADWSLFNAKVATTRALICATGLAGCGDLSADRTLTLDVNNLTTKGTAADADLFLVYDPVAAAHRKMTRTTVLSGIGGTLIFKGVWDANTNTPTLTDGTGTTNWFYIASVAGTQDLGSGAQTFAVGDLVVHNGSVWKKVATGSIGVTSFNSRQNAVVPVAGDYTATQVTNTPAGGVAAVTVQAAITELDSEKATASATLTANLPVIGNGTNALTVGTRSGNTTQYVTTTGAQTSGDCVKIDANGNHVANGSSCGTGGGTSTSNGALYTSTPAGTAITANVYAKLAGATTSTSLSDFTMTADNRLRYDGAATISFKFVATVALRGTANNLSASIRLAKNSTTIAGTTQTVNLANSTRAESLTTTGIVSLATNDFVEVWGTAVSNTTLTADSLILNVFATGGREAIRGFGATFGKCGGTGPAASDVVYIPDLPYSCTISGWSIAADAGTATFKVWRATNGTAIPTGAGSINTSGVSLSAGTRVRSSTVTDFTDTTLDQHDVLAITLTAVSGATCVSTFVQCDIQ
jgi:hypothetical protein